VRADLGAVREAATLLAAQEREPTFAADAAPSLQDIRDAAATVRDASSLTAASAAAGALGAVCGECHARTGAHPSFAEVLKPKEDETLLGHMARHAWAVNRLWEALVKGDAALWTRGLNELAEPPLGPDILGTSPPPAWSHPAT
jgi:hypothetical protein